MIKKINYVFTIILAILVVNLIYSEFNIRYNNDIVFKDHQRIESEEIINLRIFVNPRETGYSNEEYVDDALKLIEKLDLPASIMFAKMDTEEMYRTTYVYSTRTPSLFSHIYLKDNSFSETLNNHEWLITNDFEVSNASYIDYLNAEYYTFNSFEQHKWMIQPLSKAKSEIDDGVSQIVLEVFTNPSNRQVVSQTMIDDLASYINNPIPENAIHVFDKEVLDYRQSNYGETLIEKIIRIPYSILILSMLCMLFISVYVSIKQTKEIVIGYMHGYSLKIVLFKFFFPYMVTSFILFSGVLLITSYIISDSHGALYFEFVKKLIQYVYLYIGITTFSFLFAYTWVKYRFSSVLLKENSQHNEIFIVMSLLKVGIILTLSIPLLTEIHKINQRLPYLKEIRNNQLLKEGVTISFSGMNNDALDEHKKMIEDMSSWVKQNMIGYADILEYHFFSSNNSDSPPKEYLNTSNGITVMNQPYIIVNTRYLNDYANISVPTSDEVQFLLHQSYKEKPKILSLLSSQSTSDILFYEESITFIPHNETSVGALTEYVGVVTDPIIIIDQSIMDKSDRFEANIVEYKNPNVLYSFVDFLETKYPTTFTIQSVNSSFQRIFGDQNKSHTIAIQFSMMYSILLIIFIVTSIGVYLTSHANELVIQYMNGYGYSKRYKKVYLYSLLVSVFGLAYVGYIMIGSSQVVPIAFGVLIVSSLLLEIVSIYSMTYLFEQKNISTILKGER